jgi:hypothetical protein
MTQILPNEGKFSARRKLRICTILRWACKEETLYGIKAEMVKPFEPRSALRPLSFQKLHRKS